MPVILHRGLQVQKWKVYNGLALKDPDEKLNLNLEVFPVGCSLTAAQPVACSYVASYPGLLAPAFVACSGLLAPVFVACSTAFVACSTIASDKRWGEKVWVRGYPGLLAPAFVACSGLLTPAFVACSALLTPVFVACSTAFVACSTTASDKRWGEKVWVRG